MSGEPTFVPEAATLRLAEIARLAGIDLPEGAPDIGIQHVAALEEAGPADLAYMDNPRYLDALETTRAGICLVAARYAARVPSGSYGLVVPQPYRAYGLVLSALYPASLRPGSTFGSSGISPGSCVHPSARLEDGVVVDPGAVIGPGVEIGRGTIVGAAAVIGPGVRIGRDCSIGAQTTLQCALLGNRVILHPGARIGQDGFGYAQERGRHVKMPQIGRVVIQDDVEVGANTTIDRGATRDTVIGEGTKIDNLVQIAHNVVIGRHCVIVSQTGISGSTTLEDYVVLAGQVGVVGHVRIGQGSQIAGSSNVNADVPPGSRWGGTPAKPVRDWFREITTLKRLAARPGPGKGEPD